MNDVLERVINAGVLATMVGAGLAYSRLLWSLNLRPSATLFIVGILPGLIFTLTLWAIRAVQGTPSILYIGITLDWVVFAGTAVGTVVLARRWHK